MTIWIVGIGGSLGAAARYGLSQWLNKYPFFPLGTWITNIFGSFILGLCLQYYIAGFFSVGWWAFLGIGICGGFTTFSTFGTEVVSMLQHKKWKQAIFYIITTVILSLFGTWLGIIF
ncbi:MULTISPECIES: fluoride efflux transporter CrcB [Oceanobacillus]|uniref:Fluoride-specific ion channel FluC n=1 Tax=Oceanobacillus kimchii TaxID=746691 RepID=A0ABQ5TLM1_9BACI|nr:MULTISPECIES: fluoride efflux transporter CrcB [Oceanobacillus]MBT2600321.1 fluoride efflux transporter CrcB [Oceanobacillus sp. ISL-74]MBT2650479.1 fluoride efflux transporter CrcB [Oceanobacillus sp. ISL-73]GLO67370.1 putative fluoride ion transporter CrcB 2 [Oceanobacillus kimchii]